MGSQAVHLKLKKLGILLKDQGSFFLTELVFEDKLHFFSELGMGMFHPFVA